MDSKPSLEWFKASVTKTPRVSEMWPIAVSTWVGSYVRQCRRRRLVPTYHCQVRFLHIPDVQNSLFRRLSLLVHPGHQIILKIRLSTGHLSVQSQSIFVLFLDAGFRLLDSLPKRFKLTVKIRLVFLETFRASTGECIELPIEHIAEIRMHRFERFDILVKLIGEDIQFRSVC